MRLARSWAPLDFELKPSRWSARQPTFVCAWPPILRRLASQPCTFRALVSYIRPPWGLPLGNADSPPLRASPRRTCGPNSSEECQCRSRLSSRLFPPQGECDRALSKGQFRVAGQSNSFRSVAVTLTNSEGGFARSFEGIGSTKFAVSFIPGANSERNCERRYRSFTPGTSFRHLSKGVEEFQDRTTDDNLIRSHFSLPYETLDVRSEGFGSSTPILTGLEVAAHGSPSGWLSALVNRAQVVAQSY